MEKKEETNPIQISLKEIEVARLNLQKGDVLALKLRGDELMDQAVIQSLKNNFQLLFPDNKIIVLGLGEENDVNFEILNAEVKAEEIQGCSVGSYCADCSCGKKERFEKSVEDAALRAAENFGPPEHMFDPENQEWIIRDGKLTEYGIEYLQRKVRGK